MITKYSPAVDLLNSLSLKNNTLGSPVPFCWKQWAKETKIFVILYTQDYNRQQNELRHFALNWAFLRFTDFKRRKYSFSFPIPSMQCCSSYLQKTTNTPTLNGGGRGGVRILLFSEVTPFEYNVSTILSPIVAIQSNLLNTDYKGKSQVSLFQVSSL